MTEELPLTWSEYIGFLGSLRMNLAQVRPDIFPMTYPRLPADSASLEAAEHRVGHKLNEAHREFLSVADGWPDFMIDVELLGSKDIGAGALWQVGQATLDTFFSEGCLPPGFPARSELMPIAVGTESIDLHVVWMKGPVIGKSHPILWLAGEEVQRWSTFQDYLSSVYSYTERRLAKSKTAGVDSRGE